jgi:PKD repeat protein
VAPCATPLPNFTASGTNVCEGLCIDFTDLTGGSPTAWNWTFPGGSPSTSNAQNPTVCYSVAGLYGVTLSATNANGTADTTFVSYITVGACDTLFVPTSGTSTETECSGVIMDDGGPSNYTSNSDGSVTISPTNAVAVNLTFSVFTYETGDSLYLYDGPDQLSPLIGAYSGSTLPNGGSVTASSGSLTVRQVTNGSGTNLGFEATWDCQLDGIFGNALIDANLNIYPNPSSDVLNIEYTSDAKSSPFTVSMVNALGQVVFSEELTENSSFTSQIDVSSLGRGIYFVIVQSSDHQIVRKAVIE